MRVFLVQQLIPAYRGTAALLRETGWQSYQILSQVSRRLDHQVSLQGLARRNARKTARDHSPDLYGNERPDHQRCSVHGSCAHVSVDPAASGAIDGYATDQGSVIAQDPDGVSQPAKTLLGETVLGAGIFFNYIRKCDRRYHTSVSGTSLRT